MGETWRRDRSRHLRLLEHDRPGADRGDDRGAASGRSRRPARATTSRSRRSCCPQPASRWGSTGSARGPRAGTCTRARRRRSLVRALGVEGAAREMVAEAFLGAGPGSRAGAGARTSAPAWRRWRSGRSGSGSSATSASAAASCCASCSIAEGLLAPLLRLGLLRRGRPLQAGAADLRSGAGGARGRAGERPARRRPAPHRRRRRRRPRDADRPLPGDERRGRGRRRARRPSSSSTATPSWSSCRSSRLRSRLTA